jgi:DNA invertase Pin-like site-specific DNA recombinase
MKLLGYVRVSTSGQADNFSIQDQAKKISSYCDTFEHELAEIFQDTYSGATLNRIELKKLLEKLNDYDGLIVYKLDRLSRSAKDTLELLDQIKAKGKNLISVNEQFDFSTPTGKLFLTMLSGFAEYEREVIKERVTNGRRAKKATGSYSGGQPKLGYRVKHETTSVNGKIVTNKSLEVDSEEQKIIDLMRRHKKSGKSFYSIANWLNDNGFKTKQGKAFTVVQVKRVLSK